MKFLLIIQGEGRGHTTQAIAFKEIIEKYGHSVELAIIGHRGDRPTTMVTSNFENVVEIQSPNLVYKKGQKHISLFKTLKELIFNIPKYVDSVKKIDYYIKLHTPDVVINFYESMFGVYRFVHRPNLKSFAVGHQFMFFHPDYISMKSYPLQMWGAKIFTWLVGYGSEKIALSFYEAPQYKQIHVVPPVLRKQVFESSEKIINGNYVLVYCINQSYIHDLTLNNSPCRLEIFTEIESTRHISNDVVVHPLNGQKFLEMMAGAKMVICTAGFETVAEALYLGKPVLMQPVFGHMEQEFNAKDAETNVGNCKKINSLKEWKNISIEMDNNIINRFRNWTNSYEYKLLKILQL
jgi:uncharacterized protein (TIGR00661 family)